MKKAYTTHTDIFFYLLSKTSESARLYYHLAWLFDNSEPQFLQRPTVFLQAQYPGQKFRVGTKGLVFVSCGIFFQAVMKTHMGHLGVAITLQGTPLLPLMQR